MKVEGATAVIWSARSQQPIGVAVRIPQLPTFAVNYFVSFEAIVLFT